jgi:hypothetical protein
MLEWLFGNSIEKPKDEPWVCKIPEVVPYPPSAPIAQFTGRVAQVKEEQRKLLTACLTGGMTYEAAKLAVEAETAEEMQEATEADDAARKINEELVVWYREQCDEYSESLRKRNFKPITDKGE